MKYGKNLNNGKFNSFKLWSLTLVMKILIMELNENVLNLTIVLKKPKW